MIVLDRSSSMTHGMNGSLGGESTWSIASDVLADAVHDLQAEMAIGLMVFPSSAGCSAGAIVIPPAVGPDTSERLRDQLSEPPPEQGNHTPLAESMATLAASSVFSNNSRGHIVVITDGYQYCSDVGQQDRYGAADIAGQLATAGVKTHVIGFGQEVDVLALNFTALNGQTALEGCTPSGDSPDGPVCYRQVDNRQELSEVLADIAANIRRSDGCTETAQGI